MIDYREAPLSRQPSPTFQPDSSGQPVLLSQGKAKIEDVLASTVGQGVPVQMGWRQPCRQDSLDLRSQLQLHLFDARLGDELRCGARREQVAIAVE